jgi:hypothetical protein
MLISDKKLKLEKWFKNYILVGVVGLVVVGVLSRLC